MRVLVAVEDYVGEGRAMSHRFVHVRNKYYLKQGIDVTVLNFSCDSNYTYEEVNVISLASYKNGNRDYDILICHQPNIKHHFVFLGKYEKDFKHLIFFFHGHEVLKINKAYSEPYDYMRQSKAKVLGQDIYDDFKLAIWRHYYPKRKNKSTFVFVSKWMLDEFLKWTQIPYSSIKNQCMITYNCIGQAFEDAVFEPNCEKKYDLITIRNNLDGSKYCVDFVNELAKKNPQLSFLLVGKGEIFDHYKKADNLTWFNQTMNHQEIIQMIQTARCALMPTRTDAQGLMMCELASTGMPLITSDIPVCHEVFDDFKNVVLIKNEEIVELDAYIKKLESGLPYDINDKYYNSNTSQAEVDLINSLDQ